MYVQPLAETTVPLYSCQHFRVLRRKQYISGRHLRVELANFFVQHPQLNSGSSSSSFTLRTTVCHQVSLQRPERVSTLRCQRRCPFVYGLKRRGGFDVMGVHPAAARISTPSTNDAPLCSLYSVRQFCSSLPNVPCRRTTKPAVVSGLLRDNSIFVATPKFRPAQEPAR